MDRIKNDKYYLAKVVKDLAYLLRVSIKHLSQRQIKHEFVTHL